MLNIRLNRPEDSYIAGETIRGTVIVRLISSMTITGIYVFAKGIESSYGNSEDPDPTRGAAVSKVHLKEKIQLVGSGSEMKLDAGVHEYPFVYNLSTESPSTFQSLFGRVRYYVKATIVRPIIWNVTKQLEFTVIGRTTFNEDEYKDPYSRVEQLDIWPYCCSRGKVNISLTLNKRYFKLGETILISGTIKNNTYTLIMCRCVLRQIADYNGAYSSTEDIVSIQHGAVAPLGEVVWINEPLLIPRTLPVSNNSSLLKISYVLKVLIYIPFTPWRNETKVIKPDIIIGSVAGLSSESANVVSQPIVIQPKSLPTDLPAEPNNDSYLPETSMEKFASSKTSAAIRY